MDKKKYENITVIPQGSNVSKGNISKIEIDNIIDFFNKYGKLYLKYVLKKNLDPYQFDIFKHANILLVIDDDKIIMLKSLENYSPSLFRINHIDNRGNTSELVEYMKIAENEMGYKGLYSLEIPLEYYDMNIDESMKCLKKKAEKHFNTDYQLLMDTKCPPTLSEEEIELFISKANEDIFTEYLIIPLLKQIGFEKVIKKGHKDKTMEFGQDLKLFSFTLPTNHQLYFVAQIKVGNIGASSKQPTKEISQILTEINPAFTKSVFDPYIGRNITPDHVFLIVSGSIGEQAKVFIHEQINKSQKRDIQIIEKYHIKDLFFKYSLPERHQKRILKFIGKIRTKLKKPDDNVVRDIMKCLEDEDSILSIKDIAKKIGKSPSTTSRYLYYLEERKRVIKETSSAPFIFWKKK